MSIKRWTGGAVAVVMAAGLGFVLGQQGGGMGAKMPAPAAGDGPCDGAAAEYWVAPMDSSFRRDEPGKSPMGMDLVPYCGGRRQAGTDVQIEPAVEQSLGVRTAVAQREVLARPIRAVGTVGWDEDSLQMVHTRAEGWLEQIGVATAGERVEAGELLFALFSPKLIAAEREYLAAGGHRALRVAAAERLMALGYTADQITALERRGRAREHTEQRAQKPLVVASLDTRPGQFVTPGTMVMTLADLSRVWITVDVPERHAAALRQGAAATATVAAYPARSWEGQVDLVYPRLNSATRTLRARLVFDNADGALQPDMFATVTLRAAGQAPVLSVPSQAVIRTGEGARVVKVISPGSYSIVPVQPGQTMGERTVILGGLEAGDQVVFSGQFLIDSEANLDAETLRMRASTRPSGHARAEVQAVDLRAGTVTLRHGPIRPEGDAGLSMPGMTMDFRLGDAVSGAALEAGSRVQVRVEQRQAGDYVVTAIEPIATGQSGHGQMDHGEMDHGEMDHGEMDHGEMDHGEMDHGEMDHGEMDHGEMDHGEMDHGEMDHGEMDHGQMDHGQMESGGSEDSSWTRARIKAINPGKRAVVLDHEMIHSIGMPGMTMGFSVAEGVDLTGFGQGDAVRVRVDIPEDGVYRVTAMEPAR